MDPETDDALVGRLRGHALSVSQPDQPMLIPLGHKLVLAAEYAEDPRRRHNRGEPHLRLLLESLLTDAATATKPGPHFNPIIALDASKAAELLEPLLIEFAWDPEGATGFRIRRRRLELSAQSYLAADDTALLDRLCGELLDETRQLPEGERRTQSFGTTHRVIGSVKARTGRLQEAEMALQNAVDELMRGDPITNRALWLEALRQLCWVLHLLGDDEALVLEEGLGQLFRTANFQPSSENMRSDVVESFVVLAVLYGLRRRWWESRRALLLSQQYACKRRARKTCQHYGCEALRNFQSSRARRFAQTQSEWLLRI